MGLGTSAAIGLGFILSFKGFGMTILDSAGASITKMDDATGKLTKSLGGLKKAGALGAGLMGIGVAGLAGLGMASKASTEFEYALSEVKTIIRDMGKFDMPRLKQTVLDLAMATGEMPVDLMKAMYQTISAGIQNQDQAMHALDKSSKAAIAGMTDTFTAVDVMTSITNAYGLKVNELASANGRLAAGWTRTADKDLPDYYKQIDVASDLLDVMFVGVREGKTTFEQLHAGIGRVIPLAKDLGMSYRDVIGTVSALTRVGLQTSQAYTGMRSIMIGLNKQTNRTIAWSSMLGYEFDANAVRSKGWSKWLTGLGQAMNNFATDKNIKAMEEMAKTGVSTLGGVRRVITKDEIDDINYILNKIKAGKFSGGDVIYGLLGRIEGANAAVALLSNNAEMFSTMMEQMNDSEGAFMDAYEKVQNTVHKTIERIKAIYQVIKIYVGDAVNKMVVPWLIRLENALLKVTMFLSENTEYTEKLVSALAKAFIVLTVAGGFLLLAAGLGSVIMAAPVFLAGLGAMAAVISPLGLIVAGLAFVIKEVIASFIRINTTIGPLTKLDSAMAVIFNTVKFLWLGIKDGLLIAWEALSKAWSDSKVALTPLIDAFKEVLPVISENEEGLKKFGYELGVLIGTMIAFPVWLLTWAVKITTWGIKTYVEHFLGGMENVSESMKSVMQEFELMQKDNQASFEQYLMNTDEFMTRWVAIMTNPWKTVKTFWNVAIVGFWNDLKDFWYGIQKFFGMGEKHESMLLEWIYIALDDVIDTIRKYEITIMGKTLAPFAGLPYLSGHSKTSSQARAALGLPYDPRPGETGSTTSGGGFAEGGIVNRPTRALVGEAGPELIIPLRKLELEGRTSTGVNMFDKLNKVGEVSSGDKKTVVVVESSKIITATDRRNVLTAMSAGIGLKYSLHGVG